MVKEEVYRTHYMDLSKVKQDLLLNQRSFERELVNNLLTIHLGQGL
jgi:hypothetical protein